MAFSGKGKLRKRVPTSIIVVKLDKVINIVKSIINVIIIINAKTWTNIVSVLKGQKPNEISIAKGTQQSLHTMF